MDSNMLMKGTEIYMKCLYALQQQNTADASMPAAPATSYFNPPKYTHHQQPLQYQSNQFLPQSHASAPYFPSPPGLETVYLWPHQQQQQQYATSFDHHRYQYSSDVFSHAKPLQHAPQNGYAYNGFDRNGIYYGTQMAMASGSSITVPTPSSSSGGCSEQNWPISSRLENTNHFDSTYGQNGSSSVDTSHMTSSMNGSGSFDVSTQNERDISMLEVKNRALEIEEQEKKVPRPMNSFMIYAKRHRAQVHQLYPLCDNRTVSKILSDTWYAMDAEKKREYFALAAEMRQEHFRLHPNFKWKTTHSETNEPQRKKSPNAATNVEPNAQSEQNRSADDSNDTCPTFQFDECGDLASPYMPTTPSTETSLSPVGCGGGGDESKMSQAIHLAPTPAQLGLCRNKKRSKANSSAAVECGNGINKNGPNGSSEQFKQRFFNLPQFDFSNYRQSSEWDASPTSPAITYNTTMRKRKSDADQQQQTQQQHQQQQQPAKRLIGNHFFGPDFNANHFNDLDANSQSSVSATPSSSVASTPNTPCSADNVKCTKRKMQDNKKRQLTTQRHSVIMELFQKCGFFPSAQDIDEFLKKHMQMFGTKSFLNVKIREYRQKYMQNLSPP